MARQEDTHREIAIVRKPGVHYCHRYPQTVLKHGDDFCGEFVVWTDALKEE